MEHTKTQRKVCDEIKDMEEEIMRTLQELVRIPSIARGESKPQDYMEELYQSLDMVVIRFKLNIEKVKKHPAFIDTDLSHPISPEMYVYPGTEPPSFVI
jgi:acetylornithine deacetylase/succinyl-diaminopimelate desuccinylase-like protein